MDWLLRICEAPADYELRLRYADWLDRSGDKDHAEFIRAQIEIDNVEKYLSAGFRCFLSGRVLDQYKFEPRCRCHNCQLRRREYQSGRRWRSWDWCQGVGLWQPKYHGGLVEQVVCTMREWYGINTEVLRRHPIRSVYFSDRTSITVLPEEVFQIFCDGGAVNWARGWASLPEI